MIHEVYGLLRYCVTPPIEAEYLVGQRDRPVSLEVGSVGSSSHGSLGSGINIVVTDKKYQYSPVTLLIKLGPSLACRAFCMACCSSLENWSIPNLSNPSLISNCCFGLVVYLEQ